MIHWAQAPMPRHQTVLIGETLDEVVASEHPIRMLDAVLEEMDWRGWERAYERQRGQPPIHPKWVAGAILYGLTKRIRSSRELEEATRERRDFQWFLEGRTIDHATFAAFRTKFEKELKDLNRQLVGAVVKRVAGPEVLELFVDGTRIRANSDRNGARTAEGLERLVAACVEALDRRLAALGEEDQRQEAESEEVKTLREEVARLRAEKDKYARALEHARRRDGIKKKIWGKKAKAVRVPVSDPEATVLPNKEGGYGPNYTPVAAVDGHRGIIVASEVAEGGDEGATVGGLVEECEDVLGKKPDRLVADGGFASGKNLARLEDRGIEAHMPPGTDFGPTNPANRLDPREPVASDQCDRLPRTKKQWNANAFVYDGDKDCYFCPMGKTLEFETTGRCQRTGIAYRRYGCPGAEGCRLATQCVKNKARRRTVARDEYQDVRDRVGRRRVSAEGQAIYARRTPVAEGPFGIIKSALGIRQFLLRGMKKVKIEWTWICGAFNLKKLLGLGGGRVQPKAGVA